MTDGGGGVGAGCFAPYCLALEDLTVMVSLDPAVDEVGVGPLFAIIAGDC